MVMMILYGNQGIKERGGEVRRGEERGGEGEGKRRRDVISHQTEFDEMKMLLSKFYLPYFCFFMWGKAALVTMKDPLRWTRWTKSRGSNVTCQSCDNHSAVSGCQSCDNHLAVSIHVTIIWQ